MTKISTPQSPDVGPEGTGLPRNEGKEDPTKSDCQSATEETMGLSRTSILRDERARIAQEAAVQIAEGIRRETLYGPLPLESSVTLAEGVSGNVPRFVDLMNSTAKQLGLDDTHYNNPIGLDGKSHYTSARDLASLSRTLMGTTRPSG